MTREEAKKFLIEIGVAEPTEAQVTAYLNQYHTSNAAVNTNQSKYEEEKKRADELQKKLEEIEQKELTELQIEKKAREKAEKTILELNTKLTKSEVAKIFAAAGLVDEKYDGMIDALSAMDIEVAKTSATSFVDGISEYKKTAIETAKTAWEKEKMIHTPNPEGDKSQTDVSAAAEFARNYSQLKNPTQTTQMQGGNL